jgi:hypothetical protein
MDIFQNLKNSFFRGKFNYMSQKVVFIAFEVSSGMCMEAAKIPKEKKLES